MDKYTIRKLLKIPYLKVTEIISIDDKEIHIKLEPYKRRLAVCSGCGKKHRSFQSYNETNVQESMIVD